MASTRDAVDTIRGYYYQFNYSILCILDSSEDNEITVEGIEDVDVASGDDTIAIQCKYYSKTEYNHSVIAQPIRFMFKDYMNRITTGNYISYKLCGNYQSGQSKLALPLTIDFVKDKFFSFTEKRIKHEFHVELSATDEQISDFISRLTIDVYSDSYEDLEKCVIGKLEALFSCSNVEAELYYYNNALRVVKELATAKNEEDRRISKKTFISKINSKKMLFDNWYLQFLGLNEFCKKIKREYFTQSNINPTERYFLIECDALIDDSDIIKMIAKILKNWSKLSQREPKPFCPYIVLQGISADRLIRIKKNLSSRGITICDGFDFLGADFNPDSLNRTPDFRNGIKVKIANELSHVEASLNIQKKAKEVYQFYLSEPYFETEKAMLYNIQIPSTECVLKIV